MRRVEFISSKTRSIHKLLKRQLLRLSLLQLGNPGEGLVAEAGSTPVLADFISPLVEVGLNSLNQLVERTLILGFNLLENDSFKRFI